MAILIILLAFYFDYKSGKESFKSDLSGGLFIVGVFILYAIIMHQVFEVNRLYIVFSIGIELILIFVLKGLFKKK